jgi:flagellar assembly factor FliW
MGGYFAGDTTAHKILRVGYYCPTLFKDAHTYARNYKSCQMSSGREKRAVVPLQLVTISRPFEQWGINVIGEIILNSSKQHKYILTATEYFTKWA